MKFSNWIVVTVCVISVFEPDFSKSWAQGTAFTYQGRLNDGGTAATGLYNITFTLFDSGTNGNILGPILTNTATPVNNGLFAVTLDFGNQFAGGGRWLEVAVCTNGNGSFTTLSPRQFLSPVPYAITAGSVLPGGIPAGVYTNAVIFNNRANQFFGNGAGVTNLPFSSLAPATQTQMTNVAQAAAAAIQSNLTALAATVMDTNFFTVLSSQHLLVAPYTNLPPYLLTNPYYFSPVRGADYIQQAINSLPSYHDRQHVGGGEIVVIGINYVPNTLVFANSGFNGNIMSYKIHAPTFTGGALVCQTTPCIHAFGYGNNQYLSDTAFEMENLIISSVQNTPSVLFDLDLAVTDSTVQHCWFGYWPYLTNQMCVGALEGLGTPNTPEGISKNNLVVKYTPGSTDRHVFSYNHLTGIACLLVDCDHFQCDYNFFMECGGNSALGVRSTDWPVATPIAGGTSGQLATLYWTGAAIVMGQDLPHRNYTFTDNYFYYCAGAYFSPWPQNNFYSYQDSYEATTFSALSPGGIQFRMIDSDAGADSCTLNGTSISFDSGSMRGGVWLDANRFPFNGNGSSLKSVPASSLVGTVPVNSLPGITTTVSSGGVTLYITNGVVMRTSTP